MDAVVLGYFLLIKYLVMAFIDRDIVIGYNAWYIRGLFKEYGVLKTVVATVVVAPFIEELVFRHLAYMFLGLTIWYWVIQVVWVVLHWGNNGFLGKGLFSRSVILVVDSLILTWFEVHMFPANIVLHALTNINSILTSAWVIDRCSQDVY